MNRRFFRPRDFVFVGALLALAILLLLVPREQGDTVYIYVEGGLYDSVRLTEEPPASYAVKTEQGVLTLAFSREGVAVTHSDCKDAVCVRTGRITHKGESIVCAPLGVCITLGEGALDGVTG